MSSQDSEVALDPAAVHQNHGDHLLVSIETSRGRMLVIVPADLPSDDLVEDVDRLRAEVERYRRALAEGRQRPPRVADQEDAGEQDQDDQRDQRSPVLAGEDQDYKYLVNGGRENGPSPVGGRREGGEQA